MAGSDRGNLLYRRGALLGLTLAEGMILLAFVLLLAVAGVLARKQTQLATVREERRRLEEEVRELIVTVEAQKAVLEEASKAVGLEVGNIFGDNFRSLRKAISERNKLEREAEGLREAKEAWKLVEKAARKVWSEERGSQELADRVATAIHAYGAAVERGGLTPEYAVSSERDARKWRGLTRLLGAAGANEEDLKELGKKLQGRLRTLQRFAEELGVEGDAPPGEVVARLRGVIQDVRVCSERQRTHQQQLEYVQARCRGGAGYPPCWINAETGKEDSIFDVAIFENGVMVRDIAYDRHAAEKKRLPLSPVRLDTLQNVDEFIDATRLLYDESVKQGCRHFVRLYDEAKSKNAFKHQMLAIEGHFYKHLLKEGWARNE